MPTAEVITTIVIRRSGGERGK